MQSSKTVLSLNRHSTTSNNPRASSGNMSTPISKLLTRRNSSSAISATRRRHRQLIIPHASSASSSPTAAATRVRLGDSDLMVSLCCLGTMTFGCQNTEADAHEQLNYAFHEAGLNFADTSEIYPIIPKEETQGLTDKYIGSWMKDQRREDIVLASKMSGYGRQTYLRADGSFPRVNEKNIVESVENSLKRLGTDYLDLLQVHWPDRMVSLFGASNYDIANEREGDVPFEEQLEALSKMVTAGKVRHIGLSNETSYGVMKFTQAAESVPGLQKIVSIQNSYSLLVRGPFETDLAEVCAPRQCNVGLLAYSPLAGGALSGKYIDGSEASLEKSRFKVFNNYMARYSQSLAKEAVAAYAAVARKHGLTPTELALAWCKSRWFVASTIIGATQMDQLKENIAAFDVELSEECLVDVAAVYRRYRDPAFN